MKLLLVVIVLAVSLVFGLAIGHAQIDVADTSFELSLTKTADATSYQSEGQIIHYTFTITNIGDYDIPGPFSVSDSKIPSVYCPEMDKLSPGQSLLCTGSYIITRNDMLREYLTNVARAEGGIVLSDLAWSTIYNDNRLWPVYLPNIQNA